MSDPIGFIRRWLDITTSGPLQDWLECVADDVVMRFPYAPPGYNGELRGIEETTKVFRGVWAGFRSFAWHDVTVRQVDDPGLYLTLARSEAVRASGEPYANEYVLLTRLRGGKVVEHIEYFNPAVDGA